MKKILLACLALMIAIPSAHALTLAEKKKKAQWETEMAENWYVPKFKKQCGYDLKVTFDDSVVAPFLKENTSAYSYCELAYVAIYNMCEDDLSREAIQAGVKALHCTAKGEQGFSLKDGTLTLSSKPGFKEIPEKTKAFLENNL